MPAAVNSNMSYLHDVLQLRVRYSETDQMGTFYNSRALEWFECGRTELMRRNLGMSYAALEARGGGGWVGSGRVWVVVEGGGGGGGAAAGWCGRGRRGGGAGVPVFFFVF